MNHNAPNLHIISAKYLFETPNRGERIKISSYRFRETVTISYGLQTKEDTNKDYSVWEVALMYLEKKGFDIIGKGEGKGEWIFVSTTFKPLK
jgi:hypothetical protein